MRVLFVYLHTQEGICKCVWVLWEEAEMLIFLMHLNRVHHPQIETAPAPSFCPNPTISPVYNNWLAFQGNLVCGGCIKHSHL